MKNKTKYEGKTVLIFVSWYLPGFKAGGPTQSIANLVDNLGDEFDFLIVSRDRDINDDSAYDLDPDLTWHQVGKAKVRYVSKQHQTVFGFGAILRETPHDVLYFNSVLDWRFSTQSLLALRLGLARRPKRIVIGPRGEFSPGALGLRRKMLKMIYLATCKAIGLYKNTVWQGSTPLEAQHIKDVLGPSKTREIAVASDLPRRFQGVTAGSAVSPKGTLRIAFLSRISPMKNLDFALEVLAKVTADVTFTVYGPSEDATYWQTCKHLMEALPQNISVDVAGLIPPADVVSTMAQHDLFFLPTRGENFGHVIVEAFQAGVPTLISNNTPWKDLAAQNLGADLSLEDPSAFVDWIEAYAAEDTATKRDRRDRVAVAVTNADHVAVHLDDSRRLFNGA